MSELVGTREKISSLSTGLQQKIIFGERKYVPTPETPVSNFLVNTKRHCNGGRTVDAGLWLKDFCTDGGKLFLSMAGAGSTFQMGIVLSDLIRAGFVAGISVTGANLEESLYRLVANEHYAYIPDYQSLTRTEEKELDYAGLRRITDTFLPEDESVRVLLSAFEKLWREAEEKGEKHFWHEYFFMLFERNLIPIEGNPELEQCWLYQAWKHGVEICVPGPEDSTMGNIFAYYSNAHSHESLEEFQDPHPINPDIIKHSFRYMQRLTAWYMETTKHCNLAFVQLGGGIAADFPICVVPHIKKDYLAPLTPKQQEERVRPWAAFVEIHSSPMSFGSYSGAGGLEKITWSKLEINAYINQIFGDYTEHFPDIAAIILGW